MTRFKFRSTAWGSVIVPPLPVVLTHAPVSSLAISEAIKTSVAIKPNPAAIVALATVVTVVVVVVTVEIIAQNPFRYPNFFI